jgi:hypothetical protein
VIWLFGSGAWIMFLVLVPLPLIFDNRIPATDEIIISQT